MKFQKKPQSPLSFRDPLERCIFLNLNALPYPVWGKEAFLSQIKRKERYSLLLSYSKTFKNFFLNLILLAQLLLNIVRHWTL